VIVADVIDDTGLQLMLMAMLAQQCIRTRETVAARLRSRRLLLMLLRLIGVAGLLAREP